MNENVTKIYGKVRFIFRHDTAENWAKENPILAAGEHGVVTDSTVPHEREKIGDGTTPWNELGWWHGPKGENGRDAVTDISYNPQSENAQSGKAVAEAIGNKQDKFADVTVDRDGNVLLTPKKDLQIAANNDNGSVALVGKSVTLYGDYTNLHGLVSVLGVLDFGYGNGRISNLGEPRADNDAVNRAYVDTAIGNIETALDSIIAIQEQLIGGESV